MSELKNRVQSFPLVAYSLVAPYEIVLLKGGEPVGGYHSDFIPSPDSFVEFGGKTYRVVGLHVFPEIHRVGVLVS